MQIKMNQLLRYRNVWLGFAMIWIVWYHSGLHIPSPLFIYPKTWGGGVDICLFASGIGCYFSLEKDPDILHFMKRRFFRLVPTYVCFIVVWLIYKQITTPMPWLAVLGNFLGIQTLTGLYNSFNWYISALVLFYFLAPYMKQLADRIRKTWAQMMVISFLLLFSVPFWGANVYIIIVTRIPIFYIGFLFAKQSLQGRDIRKQDVVYSAAAIFAGALFLYFFRKYIPEYLTPYGLHWYPFIIMAPGICILLSLVAMHMEKMGGERLIKVIETIGQNSFEIYLVHIPLYEALNAFCDTHELPISVNWVWLATIPVVAMGCLLLKKTVAIFLSLCRKISIVSIGR